MKFSFSAFLKTCEADAKAAEQGILKAVPAIAAGIDKVAAVVGPIATVIDPAVGKGIAAGDALIDEFAAAIEGGTTKNADGTLTFTVSAATVAAGESSYTDAKSWLTSIGIN